MMMLADRGGPGISRVGSVLHTPIDDPHVVGVFGRLIG